MPTHMKIYASTRLISVWVAFITICFLYIYKPRIILVMFPLIGDYDAAYSHYVVTVQLVIYVSFRVLNSFSVVEIYVGVPYFVSLLIY